MAIIANFTTVRPEMAHTRTAKDWYTFLGGRAERLGIAARLYPKYTTSYFTEAFGNVIYNDSKPNNKFLKINSLMFEWENELNEVKRIPFAEDVDPAFESVKGAEIQMIFNEKYYEENDTFIIDESKQMCIVIGSPIRKADDYWEYSVRLMDSDASAELNLEACKAGMTTRWIGNVQPELSETGCVKYTSNYEKLRGWIGELRFDIDVSARYLALEDMFVKVTKEQDGGHRSSYLFKMPGVKKVLLDNFMNGRNNSLMWQKSTMDENGKCMVQDRKQRDLIAGDGVIPQIMKQASKYVYNKLSMNVFSEAMGVMAQKADDPQGNTWAFVINVVLWNQIQKELASFLAHNKVDNQALYSKWEGKNLKVGATYNAYEFGGNTIIFHVDNAITQEYPNKGFGILIDLTTDLSNGMSPIQMFTLRDKAFCDNTITGVGVKSGEVSTPIAGQKFVLSGYAGIGVMAPYRSYVLMQN